MNDAELRKLDVWISKHVFGRADVLWTSDFSGSGPEWDSDKPCPCHYSTDPSAAMQVLEKCLVEAGSDVVFFKSTDNLGAYRVFRIVDVNIQEGTPFVEADTLPLAICLFARKLFSK